MIGLMMLWLIINVKTGKQKSKISGNQLWIIHIFKCGDFYWEIFQIFP